MRKVITSSNLNPLLKLYFYSSILANYLKFIVKILWKYCGNILKLWYLILFLFFFPPPYVTFSIFFFSCILPHHTRVHFFVHTLSFFLHLHLPEGSPILSFFPFSFFLFCLFPEGSLNSKALRLSQFLLSLFFFFSTWFPKDLHFRFLTYVKQIARGPELKIEKPHNLNWTLWVRLSLSSSSSSSSSSFFLSFYVFMVVWPWVCAIWFLYFWIVVCVLGNDFNLRLHLLLLSFCLSMCIFGMCFWIVAVGLCYLMGISVILFLQR